MNKMEFPWVLSQRTSPASTITRIRDCFRVPGHFSTNLFRREREMAQVQNDQKEWWKWKKLNEFTAETGMPVTQENGQRRYGPPLDPSIEPPPRGTEVFVGRVPRDAREPELVPVFERVGRVYDLRLMLDFSGSNRGYCYVRYFTVEEAKWAVIELNNYEIRPGRFLGVVHSVDNCRLYIGNIPKAKTGSEIQDAIDKLTDGVSKVLLSPSREKDNNNRGYAFIEYENHRAAAVAKRKLAAGNLNLWDEDVDIIVDWADPKSTK